MTLEELATRLKQAVEILAPAREQLPEDASDETVFALGEMLGAALRMRVSIKRDIQCQSPSQKPPSSASSK
jgi:hypothetical protein